MIRVGHMCVAKMMAAFTEGPQTVTDLIAVSGLDSATVRGYVRALHKELAIHRCGWDEDLSGRRCLPLYELGPGKDAPRPPKASQAIRLRKYRERKKQMALLHQMMAKPELASA